MYDAELLSGEEALHVEGIGLIGQHFNYYDQLYEKNMHYFVLQYYIDTEQLSKAEAYARKCNAIGPATTPCRPAEREEGMGTGGGGGRRLADAEEAGPPSEAERD